MKLFRPLFLSGLLVSFGSLALFLWQWNLKITYLEILKNELEVQGKIIAKREKGKGNHQFLVLYNREGKEESTWIIVPESMYQNHKELDTILIFIHPEKENIATCRLCLDTQYTLSGVVVVFLSLFFTGGIFSMYLGIKEYREGIPKV